MTKSDERRERESRSISSASSGILHSCPTSTNNTKRKKKTEHVYSDSQNLNSRCSSVRAYCRIVVSMSSRFFIGAVGAADARAPRDKAARREVDSIAIRFGTVVCVKLVVVMARWREKWLMELVERRRRLRLLVRIGGERAGAAIGCPWRRAERERSQMEWARGRACGNLLIAGTRRSRAEAEMGSKRVGPLWRTDGSGTQPPADRSSAMSGEGEEARVGVSVDIAIWTEARGGTDQSNGERGGMMSSTSWPRAGARLSSLNEQTRSTGSRL